VGPTFCAKTHLKPLDSLSLPSASRVFEARVKASTDQEGVTVWPTTYKEVTGPLKRQAKEKEDAAVASALKALEGVTGVDDKTVREVYAKFSETGLSAWVEGRKINAPAEPTKEWAAGEGPAPTDAKDAVRFEAEFAALPMSGQRAYPRGKQGFIEDRRLALGLPVKE
jgi:hypothetical protein